MVYFVSVDLKNLFLVFLSGDFLWNINIYGGSMLGCGIMSEDV